MRSTLFLAVALAGCVDTTFPDIGIVEPGEPVSLAPAIRLEGPDDVRGFELGVSFQDPERITYQLFLTPRSEGVAATLSWRAAPCDAWSDEDLALQGDVGVLTTSTAITVVEVVTERPCDDCAAVACVQFQTDGAPVRLRWTLDAQTSQGFTNDLAVEAVDLE